jgi:hypothetical protein
MTQRPSAVTFFAPDHPRLANTVKAKLEARRAELLDGIVLLPDDKMPSRAAEIRGIETAIQICIETENELKDR